MKKSLLCFAVLLTLCLASCDNNTNSNSTTSSGEQEVNENKVTVIVLSGQSNMEGSTYYDNGQNWLRNYLNEEGIDPEPFFDGIPEVETSFRGYYPYSSPISIHASNKNDDMAGLFAPTKVGMGWKDYDMGPELGIAHTIRSHATAEKPIFMIKSAFCGSGFGVSPSSTNHDYSWHVDSDGGENAHLWSETKQFIYNNLELIKSRGFEPEIKAWCWHQGETDADNNQEAEEYLNHMRLLLAEFRSEFSEYAPDQDGDNIAFIDCTIFDNTATMSNGWYEQTLSYAGVDKLNEIKKQISEDSSNNYLINASTKDPDGLNLWVGKDGCDGIYHYSTGDCFRLGQAYGEILVDHVL